MDGLIYSAFYAAIPLAALVIDTIYGDPRSDYHPVVLIGKVISFFEGKLYPEKKTSDGNMFFRGRMTSLLVLLTVGLVVGFLTWLSVKAGILMYAAVSAVVLYFTITPRALARDGMEIYGLLKAGDMVSARKRLSWIVCRDTGHSGNHCGKYNGRCYFPPFLVPSVGTGRRSPLPGRQHHGFHAGLQK